MKPSEYLIKSYILVEKPKSEVDINRLKYEQILSDLDSLFISREDVLKMIDKLEIKIGKINNYGKRKMLNDLESLEKEIRSGK